MWQCLKWQADSRSPSFKVPCLLWRLSVPRLVHNDPPLAPIVILLTPVPCFPPYLFKIEFSIIQTTCRSCVWSLSFRMSKRMCVCTFIISTYACSMSQESHPWSRYVIDNRPCYEPGSLSVFIFFGLPVRTPFKSLQVYLVFRTPILYTVSLMTWDQVLHPHKNR
jgi:hypothetical protein